MLLLENFNYTTQYYQRQSPHYILYPQTWFILQWNLSLFLQDTSPIIKAPPAGPLLNLISSRRLCLYIPCHWGLGFHVNFGACYSAPNAPQSPLVLGSVPSVFPLLSSCSTLGDEIHFKDKVYRALSRLSSGPPFRFAQLYQYRFQTFPNIFILC